MHFSGDVTLGTILSMVTFLGVTVPLFIRLGRVIDVFKQFPPHRHLGQIPQGSYIIYPRGMQPEDSKK